MNPNHGPSQRVGCLQSVPLLFFWYCESIDNEFINFMTKSHENWGCAIFLLEYIFSAYNSFNVEKKNSNNVYSFKIWKQPKIFYWRVSHCMTWLAWGAIPWLCVWCRNTPLRQSVRCERHTLKQQSDWCKNSPMRQSDWCKNTPIRQSDSCDRRSLMNSLIRTSNISLCGEKNP